MVVAAAIAKSFVNLHSGYAYRVQGTPTYQALCTLLCVYGATMKRVYRLRRSDQFRRVRRDGKSYQTGYLTLTVAPARRRHVRCGFVVGKRIGGAVERNRAKRRVREAVRLMLPLLKPGYDLVFVVRSSAVIDTPFTSLQSSIDQLLRRAGLVERSASAAAEHEPYISPVTPTT